MAFWDDIVNKLSQTWPARMGQGILGAAALPGDVYAGRTDPGSNEAIGRAADLAMGIMGGAFAAPAQRGAVGAGIRAYHGSPYDFAKFDAAHIGSGEGAQAYGHGLYFAENPAVAANYRPHINDFKDITVAGSPYNPTDPGHIAAFYNNRILNKDQLLGELQQWTHPDRPEYQAAIDLIKSGAKLPEIGTKGSRMYEVNINAKPEQFLQWDKPISEQPQTVKDLAARFGIPETATGADLYGGVRGGKQAEATARLAQEGIPGIRYLDQGSRKGGQGTSNYVVFNPEVVDILKKYGLVGALGASQLTPQGNEQ